MPERFLDRDLPALRRLIADVQLGHVSLAIDGQPFVLPIAIAMGEDGRLLLHGSTGSRWLRVIAEGVPVAMAVTSLDGLVVARSAFESSMHYRSAVLFGRCAPVPTEERVAALDILTDALIPGRVAEVRRPRAKEVAATLVLEFAIEEWSLKRSDGWPDDDDEDVAGPAWAGVLPRIIRYDKAIPAPDLREDIALPPSVQALVAD